MAICTNCGAIHHEEDLHECLIEDLVPKGKMKRKGQSVLVDNPKSVSVIKE